MTSSAVWVRIIYILNIFSLWKWLILLSFDVAVPLSLVVSLDLSASFLPSQVLSKHLMYRFNQSEYHFDHGLCDVSGELELQSTDPEQVVPVAEQEDAAKGDKRQVCIGWLNLAEVPNLGEKVNKV